MQNLTNKQIEMQEAIILACNPGLTLEAAKYKEFIPGCIVRTFEYENDDGKRQEYHRIMTYKWNNYFYCCDDKYSTTGFYDYYILGLKPTLPRILKVLGNDYYTILNNTGNILNNKMKKI